MSYSHRLPALRRGVWLGWPRETAAATRDALLWQGMRCYRALQVRQPWLAAQLRRAVLLLWWSATGQLRIQFRYWRQARKMRRAAPRPQSLRLIHSADADSIELHTASQPVVSVIIPTYGQTGFTLRCLAAIAANPPDAEIEVIVVDDAFPGDETGCLARVRGIRLLRNATNIGYLRSCNAAARHARGDFLLFLNNDTQILPNWADAMLALFRSRTDAGAVGSKLLFPDGRLQEAGGIIWSDGSGWNFGRYDNPDRPVYNYVREVDYCSGASLMVRRDVFLGMGGFDARFAPAYYEDTDICFRLRGAGLKTLYQPASVVVHHEGASHGHDLAAGIKACQALNQRKFTRRWADVLPREHYPNGTWLLRAMQHARHRTVALIVDHQVPEHDRDAGSCAMLCVMRALLAEGMVVKFWPHNLLYKAGYVEALQQLGVEVMYGPHQVTFAAWLRENGAQLDLVVLSRPEMAEDCLPAVRAHSAAKVVYYGHDLHFSRMRMQGTTLGDERMLRAADRMEERERAVWRASDVIVYLSDEEAEWVRSMEPAVAARSIVPYCFDAFGDARLPAPGHEIIFVAGFAHPPNEDAVCWFVDAVLPRVAACVPDVALSIVGSNPTARVRALARGGVRVSADVSDEDLRAAYGRARVAVVPLRCGAGVKLKVVEALREGLPLVTTPIGAQGLPGLREVAAVHADAAAFADAVIELLTSDAQWQRQSAAQLAYARQRFGTEVFRAALLSAFGIVRAGEKLAA